jgi:hypothetical protein
VLSGGTGSGLNVKAGGTQIVSGGIDISATVSSGGVLEALGNASLTGERFLRGATFELGSGFEMLLLTVSSGVAVKVLSSGTDILATINSGGKTAMRPDA